MIINVVTKEHSRIILICLYLFQFIPKLTPVVLTEIEHILDNRPSRMRDHVTRWLEMGSQYGGPDTFMDMKEKNNLLNRDSNQEKHDHKKQPHRMGGGGGGGPQAGCVVMW